MHLALKCFPAIVQLRAVQGETWGQIEQLEIIGRQ
jgi:hypothetical protein